MAKYKLLILDYGGVYSFGYDNNTQSVIAKSLFGAERPSTVAGTKLYDLENRFSSATVTTQEYINELAEILEATKKPTSSELEKAMLDATKPPSPEMVSLVPKVQAMGIKVVLLSDMCAFEVPLVRDLGRFDGFDYALLSADLGMSKKNPDYFNAVFERLPDFSASDALFYDDSKYCIDTASKLGIKSVLVDSSVADSAQELADSILADLS